MNAVWLTVTGSPLLRSFPPPSPRVEEEGGQGGWRGGHQLLAIVPRTILEMLVTTVKSLKPSQTYSGAEGEYAILS